MLEPLPIDERLADIVQTLDYHPALVLVAEPGAGKTTRVPPALIARGPVLLLQPRRAAARSIARRIAVERGWTLGDEVGWHMRLDQKYSRATRLLVATEGILTARLQRDPLLSDFATVVLDEFHERSVHADLALALTREAMQARSDLRLVVMSATLDAASLSDYLGQCPIITVPGRQHPVDITYQPASNAVNGVEALLAATAGNVLCFQPGRGEIERTVQALRTRVPAEVELLPLHGSLPPAEQDIALTQATPRRRVVVATNIAETSLTLPGITGVVDSGLEKVARYDAERAVDSLVLERISQAAADQRAGRAGRTAPGRAIRLWHASDRLRPFRSPEIRRVDLAGVALAVIGWGGDPQTLRWLDAPDPATLAIAVSLLRRLGAVEPDRMVLTALGRRMGELPLPPRLARVFLTAGGDQYAARAVALLSEPSRPAGLPATTSSDLTAALDQWHTVPSATRALAEQLQRTASRGAISGGERPSEDVLRRALLAGFPDRVAQRRPDDGGRFLMSTGTGAVLGSESGVRTANYLVALDLVTPTRSADNESRIRAASAVEPGWLVPTGVEAVHRIEGTQVRARERSKYDALILSERIVAPDPLVAADLVARAWMERPRTPVERQLLNRIQFAGLSLDIEALVRQAAIGQVSTDSIDLLDALPYVARRALDDNAPDTIAVPSGRRASLTYGDDGTVTASVKLQELFGLAETPRIGPRREPVLLALLSPRGNPVQLTRDLKSFWERTYPEVRKELRGRYPKHPWPDDPWNAVATHRAKPRQ